MSKCIRLAALCVLIVVGARTSAQNFGMFVGTVTARWVDGRQMILTEDFAYIDRAGRLWKAPKDSLIDGASIPRPLWSLVGGPFEGDYRNASVVHDVACWVRDERWSDVHRMFYEAMLCGGVERKKALALYAAVYKFGPRWPDPPGYWGAAKIIRPPVVPPEPPPPSDNADIFYQAVARRIDSEGLTTPEEVEKLMIAP